MTPLSQLNIAIIGRGIAGLTLAARLVDRGVKPVIYGSSHDPENASRCAQGVLANKGLIFAESPLFRAKLRSLRQTQIWLDDLERSTGRTIPRAFSGVFEPYWSAVDFQEIATRVSRRNFTGCYLTRNLAAWDRSYPPFQAKRPLGVFRYPLDGWFDVQATLDALEDKCQRKGAHFRESKVLRLQTQGLGLEIICANELPQSFDRVIVAGGSRSLALLETSGLMIPKHFLIGGQTLEVPVEAEAPAIVTQVRGIASATWVGRKVIIGSSSWKGSSITTEELEKDRAALLQTTFDRMGWSLFLRAKESRSRLGTRLRFGDRMPAIGPWPLDPWRSTLWLSTGYYKNGLQLADVCAVDLIAMMEGGNPVYPEFSVARLFQ
jgi:glycine/D-amino acid oxidase-like deaminating enzyme